MGIAPDPGSCTRDICGEAAGPGFFVPRKRAGAGFTLRLKDGENPQEDSYPTTISSMAGCRVRHLVTNKGAGHGR
jgi:hypothetical protein